MRETYELDPETGEADGTVHFWCDDHAPTDAVLGWDDNESVCEHPNHPEEPG